MEFGASRRRAPTPWELEELGPSFCILQICACHKNLLSARLYLGSTQRMLQINGFSFLGHCAGHDGGSHLSDTRTISPASCTHAHAHAC